MFDLRRRRGVEDFGERGLKLTPGVVEDDGRGAECGPVIGGGVAGGQCDGDSDQGEQGRDGVGEMMPGVDADRGAVDVVRNREDVAREEELKRDDDKKNPQRVGLRQRMRRANEGNALGRDGEGLASAMARLTKAAASGSALPWP